MFYIYGFLIKEILLFFLQPEQSGRALLSFIKKICHIYLLDLLLDSYCHTTTNIQNKSKTIRNHQENNLQ